MAAYSEMFGLFNDSDLRNKVEFAVVVSAVQLLQAGAPTAEDRQWAVGVFNAPRDEGRKALMFVLADNRDSDVEQIKSATDDTLQNKVNSVREALVKAKAGL